MLPEILSIIAVCISGVTALCTACIPAILSFKAKRAELKLKEEQAYETKFKAFYQEHLEILTNFARLYKEWQIDKSQKERLISYILEIALKFTVSLRSNLYELAKAIDDNNADTEERYINCFRRILYVYGAKHISYSATEEYLPDILRVTLKEKFDALQKASSEDIHVNKI